MRIAPLNKGACSLIHIVKVAFIILLFEGVCFAATISGKIVDSQGKNVKSVNILIQSTRLGTSTDGNGKFILRNVGGEKVTLIFSHVSYKTSSMDIEISDSDANIDIGTIAFSESLPIVADPILITATRTFHRMKDSPTKISVIGHDELESGKIESVAEALQWIPGVNISGGAPGGATNRFTMLFQGLPAQYSLVLYDGRKLISEHIHTGVNLNMIPASNVDRLEVMPGAASAQYGAEAIGGVLNIIPIAPGQGPLINAVYTYGTYNTHKISLCNSKHVSDRLAYNISVDLNSTHGSEGEEHGSKTRYPVGFQRWNVLFQSKVFFSNRLIGNIDYYHTQNVNYKDKYEIEDNNLDVKSGDRLINPSMELILFGARSSTRINSYLMDFEYELKNTVNRKWITEVEQIFSIKKNTTVLFGLNSEYQSFVRKATSEHERWAFGAYTQAEITFANRLMTLVSARFDNTEGVGNVFNPKVSFSYTASPDVRIKASTGTGLKVPSLQELYEYHYDHGRIVDGVPGQYYRDGNPDLEPEKSLNMSISAEWFATEDLYVSITSYRNNLTDMIEPIFIGVEEDTVNFEPYDIFHRENISSAYTQGIQFDVIVRPVKFFRVGFNYAFMDSKNEEYDTRLAFSPTHSFNLHGGIEIPTGNFTVGAFAGYTYSMERYYYDTKEWKEKRLDDYKMLNSNISLTYRDMIEFYVSGNNLLNLELTTYEEGKQATGGGRYLSAGVRIRY